MMWLVAGVRMIQSKSENQKSKKNIGLQTTSYRISLNSAKWLAVQGVAYAFTALGIFNAYRFLPAGVVGVLFFVHPLLTILAAKLLWQEPITRRLGQSAVLAFLGAALVSQTTGSSGTAGSLVGLLWIASSAAAYSIFTLIGQRTTSGLDSTVVTTYAITFCAMFLSLLNPPVYMLTGVLTPAMWLVGLGISFVASVLAILLYVVGIKAVGASRTAVLSAAEPLSGVIVAALLLGERMISIQWLGVLVILASVWNLQRGAHIKKPAV